MTTPQVCFFTISDFVEDRVRVTWPDEGCRRDICTTNVKQQTQVRSLNIVAFSLIYIFFVLLVLVQQRVCRHLPGARMSETCKTSG